MNHPTHSLAIHLKIGPTLRLARSGAFVAQMGHLRYHLWRFSEENVEELTVDLII
jgi:hypothetical protein